ncbi:MAG: glycoside hydrolase family 25 protein [Bacteroidota bacterium]
MSKLKNIAFLSLSGIAIAGAALLTAEKVTGNSYAFGISASPSYPSFGVEIPGDYEVHGIDVSRHQRNIDWEAVSKMNHNDVSVSFAFIKASEGRTVVDEYFKDNWKAAKEAGIMRGAYHFYRPHLTAEEQMKLFVRQIPKMEKGDLPPVLDIELRGSCPPERLRKNLKKWLVLAEKQYGMKPIIYTNWGFYKSYLNTAEFRKYPLWIAHYKTPDLNQKINAWHFWQHTDRAKINGIRGGVDFNVFKGGELDLKSLCKK